MKHYDPPEPRSAPHTRRRIPAFHPVPVGPRHDGWTSERQAQFIGMLAQTRSVVAAARAVSMARESAYRLRKRPGAAGFAAAWDAAVGTPHEGVDLRSTNATGLPAHHRFASGLIVTRMDRGRYVGSAIKPDNDALLQHMAALDRATRDIDEDAIEW